MAIRKTGTTPERVVRAVRTIGRFVDQTNDIEELLTALQLLEAYATRVQRARACAEDKRLRLTLKHWNDGEHFYRELPAWYRWRRAREASL